ncbi:MAG: hypothetical protein ACYC0X_19785 [Pirellulaceae bacterium]
MQTRAMASLLYGWLPNVVPGYRRWMSSTDIDKGKHWFRELQSVLGEATSCIICVMTENVRACGTGLLLRESLRVEQRIQLLY